MARPLSRFAPLAAACALLLTAPAGADVPEAVAKSLPGFHAFAEASAALADAAAADCSVAALEAPWSAAYDAWMGVAHLRLGPSEQGGRAVAIAFWPDPKAVGARQQLAALEATDPALLEPGALAHAAVGNRGLLALKRLMFGEMASEAPYACALRRAIAADLAGMATALEAEWAPYADLLLSAGAEGNTTFLAPEEARQALFTMLVKGLEFNADQRIGRPLGSFDTPRPDRAEALPAPRARANVGLSLAALERLARALAQGLGEIPATEAAFARARAQADWPEDPAFAAVEDPAGRLKVEILQQSILLTRDAALAELGTLLGVSAGFNAGDGD
ncbi:MAG: imelysin family protein [Paracoccaceae bacterium]|jgi:hypothetical protein